MIEDARAVTLALDEIDYRSLTISLNMENGAKTGMLRLVYPWMASQDTAAGATQDRNWDQKWNAAIGQTSVSVEAVLLRRSMSLEQVSSLHVGDLIRFPSEALNKVSVIGRNGRVVGGGRLGQSNGNRAVRLIVETPAKATQVPQSGELQVQLVADSLVATGDFLDFDQAELAEPNTI